MFELVVESAGIHTTIQDLGRRGYLRFGIPESGAMDDYALQIANLLVGSEKDEAALEITFADFSASFVGEGRISITGADLGAEINGVSIEPWQSFMVRTGDILAFKEIKEGCRAYLALEGGIEVPRVMGSKSTYTKARLGGYMGRKLEEGDLLKVEGGRTISFGGTIKLPDAFIPKYCANPKIRVVLGPQDDCFTRQEMEKFLDSQYSLTNQCDRMGYRLEGQPIVHVEEPDIISDGIALGAVQIPGHGQPIVMMKDRQTVGGYAKIANVISLDISQLAQLKQGDIIQFAKVSVKEAQSLCKRRDELLNRLEIILRDKDAYENYVVRTGNGECKVGCQYSE